MQAGSREAALRLGPAKVNQEGIMFKKVLVPLDGSEIAAKVLPKVAEAAKLCKAKVTLLHVCYAGVGAFAPNRRPNGNARPNRGSADSSSKYSSIRRT